MEPKLYTKNDIEKLFPIGNMIVLTGDEITLVEIIDISDDMKIHAVNKNCFDITIIIDDVVLANAGKTYVVIDKIQCQLTYQDEYELFRKRQPFGTNWD